MNRRPAPSALLLLALTTAAGGLAACGTDDPGPAAPDPSATTAGALPITAHVLPADALPGLVPDGRAESQTPREFARAHEKRVDELRTSGFLSGSTLFFEGPHGGFGLSIAGQYDDAEDAQTEADRLFASNSEESPGMTVEPLEVPDVPGAKAVVMTGSEGGRQFTGVEIVFVEDAVLHEVFAVGQDGTFDADEVVAAVTDLHDRVAGHPVA